MPKVIHPTDGGERTPTKLYSFRLLARQLDRLETLRKRNGVPVAEQIRRGVDLWLKQQESSR